MLDALQVIAPFLVPAGIIGLLLLTVGRPSTRNDGWWLFGGVAAVIAFFAWAVAVPVVYLETTATVAKMEAFNAETRVAYEYTIDETERIVLIDNSLTEFSDQVASERIAELRDRVEWYNATLYQLQRFDRVPFIGAIIADTGDLQPIALR